MKEIVIGTKVMELANRDMKEVVMGARIRDLAHSQRSSKNSKAVLVRCENCGRDLDSTYKIKKGSRVFCEECRKTIREEERPRPRKLVR